MNLHFQEFAHIGDSYSNSESKTERKHLMAVATVNPQNGESKKKSSL